MENAQKTTLPRSYLDRPGIRKSWRRPDMKKHSTLLDPLLGESTSHWGIISPVIGTFLSHISPVMRRCDVLFDIKLKILLKTCDLLYHCSHVTCILGLCQHYHGSKYSFSDECTYDRESISSNDWSYLMRGCRSLVSWVPLLITRINFNHIIEM